MNKYQEALDNYSENVDYRDYSTKTVDIVNESYDTLQELVDKEKPKKPRIEKVLWASNQTNDQYIINHYCPECGEPLNKFTHNYCNKCGTKIDWSEE